MKTSQGFSLMVWVCYFLFFSCERPDERVIIDIEEFSIEDHLVIGETMNKQIVNMPEVFKVLDRDRYEDAYIYISTILKTLKLTAVVKNRKNFDWNITILQNDAIQTAFTLPNGHIYIYTGLLKFLKSENELVAVLGNEMAYADKGFVTKTIQAVHGEIVISDLILGRKVPDLPEIVADLPSVEFSEEYVLDADEFAIDLICPFEYNAQGLETFLKKAHAHNIKWIKSKKGEMYNRLEKVTDKASSCGEEGVTNEEQYQKFIKNFLP